jgi:hypothetical protein
VGATINLGDEDEVNGEMNMRDGQPSNDKNVKVNICLFGWWDCNVVICEVCMGK